MLSPGRILYLNFRFIHRISHWLRQRFSPAGMLILSGLVGAGIFGIDTRASLAYQVFAIMLALVLLSLLSSVVFRPRLTYRRHLPEFGSVSQSLKYRVTIENHGRRAHRDLIYIDKLGYDFPSYERYRSTPDPLDRQRNWVDRKIGYPRLMSLLQRTRGASLPWTPVDLVPAGDEQEIMVEFMPLRRGYLHFEKSCIARPDPFGLFRSIVTKDNPDKLLIMPRTYRVPRIELTGHRRYQQGGINQASLIGDSQEFMSLREYQPGDPLRSIHWRSYAKRGEPVVKEYRDEFFVRQGLILDTFIEDIPPRQFEEAVSIASSFALAVEQQDALLDLMFVGTESYHFTTGRSFGKAANMLEILACVEPSHEAQFEQLGALIGRHLGELSSLIVVLLSWDDKRRNLVQQLIASKVPLMVFLLHDDQPPPPEDVQDTGLLPGHFIPVDVDEVQASLNRIDWKREAA